LYLGADCEQSCSFCALKTYQPPSDRGDAELVELLAQAGEVRRAGIDRVQYEGIDPVRFSRVLPLTEGITALGFSRLTVMGTARRFADPVFLRDLFARAPRTTVVVAPLYGVTPEVHDSVTGCVGSFVEVRTAIDNLMAAYGRQCLAITTVPTRVNLSELAQILEFGVSLEVPVLGRLPYPLRQAGIKAYDSVALRESDLIESFAAALSSVAHKYRDGVARVFRQILQHPCVLYRAGDNSTLLPLPQERWQLEGADGSSNIVDTLPCPHVASCGLSSRCPGRHYKAYADRFGLEEFLPWTPKEPGRWPTLVRHWRRVMPRSA
jgi:hypothetical protein